MILRCYPNVSAIATSETYQILSPVLFQQSLYFPLLIHRILNLLVYIYTYTCRVAIYTPKDDDSAYGVYIANTITNIYT